MRRLLLLITIMLLIGSVQASQSDTLRNCYFRRADFGTLCSEIMRQTNRTVYYKQADVAGISVSLETPAISVSDLLKQAVSGTGLLISAWGDDYVVMKTQKLISALPPYENKQLGIKGSSENRPLLTRSEERYLTGRKSDVVLTLVIGKANAAGQDSKCTIQGRLYDDETGEPVIGATMYIQETRTGAAANANGFMSLVLKKGNYTALFECLGYEKKKYAVEVLSDGNFEVGLSKAIMQIKEVVIFGDRQMNIKSKDPGLDKISIKSIKEIPMMMGERDILKVSGMLPGVVSVGEGAAGLNIRGGGSDQNAFYINKVPIYNTSHLFGFFPAFNSDIIKDVTIYKGHIPAQYGGRLSSVFNLVAKQGNSKKFSVRGGISPVAANLVAEGPVVKDMLSVIVGGRSTYSDYILKRIDDPDISSSTAGFNDFSAAVNFNRQKLQVGAFGYHSNDNFHLSTINDYHYTTDGASVNAGYNFTPALRGELAVVASQYMFNTSDKLEVSSAYTHQYSIGHYEIRSDFKHVINDRHELEYGIGTILYKLDRGVVAPYNLASLRLPVDLGKEQSIENSVYFSDSYQLAKWLKVDAGLRYTLYAPLGAKTLYTYFEGAAREPLYIADTLSYGANQPVRWYREPDARIAINIETDKNGSVKLAYNLMHQNLFMLNNTITIAPNTQWKLADYHLKPSSCSQLSAGVFRNNQDLGLETSVEFYYKKTQNYPEFKDGADFLQNPLTEAMVLQGNNNAYGVEFFLKRSHRRIEGWLSYTYSRSLLSIDSNIDWYKINNGETYPANFDIPHIVNLLINMHFSRRVTLSGIAAYQKGKPITYPTSVYYINGVPTIDYSKRNEYRIPDYLRFDASLTFEGNLVKHKLVHSSFILSCYNLFGRDNAYSVYFKSVNGKIKSYQYSVIGVPILTFTWLFKLGNYASE